MPYRVPPKKPEEHAKYGVELTLGQWAAVLMLAGLFCGVTNLIGFLHMPEIEVEKPPSWRERGCIELCGGAEKVRTFARDGNFSYLCQCEGAEPLPADAFRELW